MGYFVYIDFGKQVNCLFYALLLYYSLSHLFRLQGVFFLL